jgi:hypothetical protein
MTMRVETRTIERVRPWDLLCKALPGSSLDQIYFNIPLEMIKGRNVPQGCRPLRGVASTPHKDLQSEDVVQKGLDTKYFLRYGYYNDDHQKGHKHKVGQPTLAVVKATEDRFGHKTTGLWTEGFLWKAGLHEGADAIYELAKALAGSGADRSVGFSIEGKVLQRDGNRIIKAWIQDIAITASPINTYTWLEVVDKLNKSVWANERDVHDLRRSVGDMDLYKSSSLLDDDGWEELRKEEEVDNELKALAAASNPLAPQSLDDNMKITTYRSGGCATKKRDRDDDNEVSKALRMSYQIARSRGWSPTHARALAIASVTKAILA